jgi:hypothetical protein
LSGESKKDGRTQPDRCVEDADKPDHEDHMPTLRKSEGMCQAGNASVACIGERLGSDLEVSDENRTPSDTTA